MKKAILLTLLLAGCDSSCIPVAEGGHGRGHSRRSGGSAAILGASAPPPAFSNTAAIEFGGTDEYITFGDVDTLNNSLNVSISAWVRSTGAWGSGTQGIFGKTRSTLMDVRALAGGALRWYIASTTNFTPGGTVHAADTYYHIVLTYDAGLADGSRVVIYIDGAASTGAASGAQPAAFGAGNNDALVAGALTIVPASPMTGFIDDVAIWEGLTLSLAQAQEVFNGGSPGDLDDTSFAPPDHWWRMGDGATFPTIPDVGTPGGADGTMTNMEAGDISSTVP